MTVFSPQQKKELQTSTSPPLIGTSTHFLCDIVSSHLSHLSSHGHLRPLIENWLSELDLHILGTTAHDFTPSGFTLVFCLSESHLSVHTFPEKGLAAIDVYLSNYKNENSAKGKDLLMRLVDFFEADSYCLHEIKR